MSDENVCVSLHIMHRRTGFHTTDLDHLLSINHFEFLQVFFEKFRSSSPLKQPQQADWRGETHREKTFCSAVWPVHSCSVLDADPLIYNNGQVFIIESVNILNCSFFHLEQWQSVLHRTQAVHLDCYISGISIKVLKFVKESKIGGAGEGGKRSEWAARRRGGEEGCRGRSWAIKTNYMTFSQTLRL